VPAVPLAERVVEVIADAGETAQPRYRYGSGCIVRGRTVLTAAHVVSGAAKVMVRDPDKKLYDATVEPRFVGDPAGPGPDLALIEIGSSDVDLPPIGLAAVDRDSPNAEPVERCQAVGYPWFAQTQSPTAIRDTVDMVGVIPVLSKLASGLLSVLVRYPPRELPPKEATLTESAWSGMSGAPVVADGYLLGVVTEHAPREGPSSITAVPLTALDHHPAHPGWGPGIPDTSAWWAQLGVTGADSLLRMPAKPQRPEPAYRATLREFGRTLHTRMPKLVGREAELAEIAAFAAGPPGYRWLVGGAFAGKSALTYEAITSGLPAEVDVVSYFLSRRASDADSNRFLAALVPQLAYLCDVQPPAADRDQLNLLWEQAAGRAVATGRNLVLVVDGLDEDVYPTHSPSVASLLPTFVEGRSHVLVTSRPSPELPDDVLAGHPLNAARRVTLEPFEGSQELATRAEKEIRDLTRGPDRVLALTVLGLLTAAAGPLSVRDLAGLSADVAPPSAAHRAQVTRLVTEDAARSLEPVGSGEFVGYQFAHRSLLEYARSNPALSDREYPERIRRWAAHWRELGWPTTTQADTTTPRYLLDGYLEMLAHDADALASLVGDVGWVEAAIRRVGVERVLAALRAAATDGPTTATVSAMLAVVAGQAQNMVLARPLGQPGYVLRHLCLRALELGEDGLVDAARTRMLAMDDPGPVPLWTTHKASHALSAELSRQLGRLFTVKVFPDGRVVCGGVSGLQVWDPLATDGGIVSFGAYPGTVGAVGLLHDGRVVTGDRQGRLRVWDPAAPDADPIELGDCERSWQAVDVLADGRVVSAGHDGAVQLFDPEAGGPAVELGRYGRRVVTVAGSPDGRVFAGGDGGRILMWNPAEPRAGPVEVGHHGIRVYALGFLPDGRLVSGGRDGLVRMWDPDAPGAPVELGRHSHDSAVLGVAVLGDDRVVSCGFDCRVRVWNLAAPGSSPGELGSHDGPAIAVAMLPDGRVASGGGDGRVRVWDTHASTVGAGDTNRDDAWPDAVALLPDGRAVTAGRRGRIVVWDPATPSGEPVELGHRRASISALALLADGRLASDGADWRPLLWDPADPGFGPVELGPASIDEDDEYEYSIEHSCSLAALPDGRLVSNGGRWLRLWATDDADADLIAFGPGGAVLDEEPTSFPHPVAVLPGGRVVSAHDDGRMLIWDPASPGDDAQELGRLDSVIMALTAIPDGRLVSADGFGRLLIWNPETPGGAPAELASLDEDSVDSLAALPDGRVVSGGGTEVRVWDCSTARETARIALAFAALAVTPMNVAEQRLVTAHLGHGITLWCLPSPVNQPR
jgi:WD40 repeat protein